MGELVKSSEGIRGAVRLIKDAILQSQARAIQMVNLELLPFYYGIGRYVLEYSRKEYFCEVWKSMEIISVVKTAEFAEFNNTWQSDDSVVENCRFARCKTLPMPQASCRHTVAILYPYSMQPHEYGTKQGRSRLKGAHKQAKGWGN